MAGPIDACLLSIVIVNWNSGLLLGKCLDSIERVGDASFPSHEIIVVDNDSSDASLDGVSARSCVRIVRNDANYGFGRACNIGALAATGTDLIFLNPDCELRPGSVQRCLSELRSPAIGVCGVALLDETGSVARTSHRFPTVAAFLARTVGLHLLARRGASGAMDDWDHASDADVDHVIGAFYAMRHELFLALGGFDERFFVYLEDLDLSLRVHRAGYRVRFLASPPSFHVGGGVSRQIKARRLFYATRSRILYAYKHFGRPQAHLHLALTLLIEPLTRSVQALVHRSAGALSETWRGFALLWGDLPAMLRSVQRR